MTAVAYGARLQQLLQTLTRSGVFGKVTPSPTSNEHLRRWSVAPLHRLTVAVRCKRSSRGTRGRDGHFAVRISSLPSVYVR